MLKVSDAELFYEPALQPTLLEHDGYRPDLPVGIGEYLTFPGNENQCQVYVGRTSNAWAPLIRNESDSEYLKNLSTGQHWFLSYYDPKVEQLYGGNCAIHTCKCPQCTSLTPLERGDRILTFPIPPASPGAEKWHLMLLLVRGLDDHTSSAVRVLGAASRDPSNAEANPVPQTPPAAAESVQEGQVENQLFYHAIPGAGAETPRHEIQRTLLRASPRNTEVSVPDNTIIKIRIEHSQQILDFIVNSVIFDVDKPPRWRHDIGKLGPLHKS